jgi:DNA-binding transcriptional MerR regulator
MNEMMTIQAFSDMTGLPASMLRYYEKEALIFPDERADNGYRLYRKEQIQRAVLIHSLRQAGLPLAEIHQYLSESPTEKLKWMNKWRNNIDSKLAYLNVAKQFLYGIEPEDEHIRLIKWDEPVQIAWYPFKVKRASSPYAEVVKEKAASFFLHAGIRPNDVYVRQETIVGNEMIGKVGFRIQSKIKPKGDWLREVELEHMMPTLFVTLDCLMNDDYACFGLMLLLQKFGFEPAGDSIACYQLHDMSHYQWMVPVHYVDTND